MQAQGRTDAFEDVREDLRNRADAMAALDEASYDEARMSAGLLQAQDKFEHSQLHARQLACVRTSVCMCVRQTDGRCSCATPPGGDGSTWLAQGHPHQGTRWVSSTANASAQASLAVIVELVDCVLLDGRIELALDRSQL